MPRGIPISSGSADDMLAFNRKMQDRLHEAMLPSCQTPEEIETMTEIIVDPDTYE